MPQIQVSDIQMYYEIHGAGQPLVLIAGLGVDVSEWGRLIRQLAGHYRVLAFDNRGVGRTDKPDAPYSMEMMADDTAALMQAVGFDSAVILGISMGGRIALELALRHPKNVRQLILISTNARVIPSWRRGKLLDMLSMMPVFKSRYPQPHYAFIRQREASAAYDGTARLGRIQAPTLILHGRSDKIAPYELATEMQAGIPGAQLQAFHGGHLFFLIREPQAVLAAVCAFTSSQSHHLPSPA